MTKLPDLIQVANAATQQERRAFAIDEAKDDDDLDADDAGGDDDAGVMDEVRFAFLLIQFKCHIHILVFTGGRFPPGS